MNLVTKPTGTEVTRLVIKARKAGKKGIIALSYGFVLDHHQGLSFMSNCA